MVTVGEVPWMLRELCLKDVHHDADAAPAHVRTLNGQEFTAVSCTYVTRVGQPILECDHQISPFVVLRGRNGREREINVNAIVSVWR